MPAVHYKHVTLTFNHLTSGSMHAKVPATQ